MSHQQQGKPSSRLGREPVKFGDVLPVTGDLAGEPIAPQDAVLMRSAEAAVLGRTHEREGLVGRHEAGGIPSDQGVSVAQADLPGGRIVTESVAGQVVGQYASPTPESVGSTAVVTEVNVAAPAAGMVGRITIGEALEATAIAAGDKTLEQSDAAAVLAAEARVTGMNVVYPGGLASAAQAAADANALTGSDDDKATISDVLTGATKKMPADKVATSEDAARVAAAEIGTALLAAPHPRGVAAAVATAASINDQLD